MKRMIDQILRQYGVSAEVEHEGKVVRLRIFFQPSMSKSWDSMNPIVTPLGQLPGGQYLYIGPADQPIGQGDQVTVGGEVLHHAQDGDVSGSERPHLSMGAVRAERQ